MVLDQDGKPRGYAFVEFEHERDMRAAYKKGDGMTIDGRRILLDVERGRTMKDWKPRRLGACLPLPPRAFAVADVAGRPGGGLGGRKDLPKKAAAAYVP